MNLKHLYITFLFILIGCATTSIIEELPEKEEIIIDSDYYFEGRYNIWHKSKDTLVQSPMGMVEWLQLDTTGQAKQSFRLPPTSTGGDSKVVTFKYGVQGDTLFLYNVHHIHYQYIISAEKDTLTEINAGEKSSYVAIRR